MGIVNPGSDFIFKSKLAWFVSATLALMFSLVSHRIWTEFISVNQILIFYPVFYLYKNYNIVKILEKNTSAYGERIHHCRWSSGMVETSGTVPDLYLIVNWNV